MHFITVRSVYFSQSLEAIKRKRFLFEHPHQSHDQPGPSHQTEPSTMCDTCGIQLPADDEQAAIHVSSCQGQLSAGSSDSEEYEEYTWCNVTRVRATSMLSAETRASELVYHLDARLARYY